MHPILALSVVILQCVSSFSCRSITQSQKNSSVKSAEDTNESYELKSDEILELLQPFLEPNSEAMEYQQIQKNLAKLTIEPYLESNSTNRKWLHSPYNAMNKRKQTIAPLAIILTNLADVKQNLARNKIRMRADETKKGADKNIHYDEMSSVVQYHSEKSNVKQNSPVEVINADGSKSYYLDLESQEDNKVQSGNNNWKSVPTSIPETQSSTHNVTIKLNKIENKNGSLENNKNEKFFTDKSFASDLKNILEPPFTMHSKNFTEDQDTKIDESNNIKTVLFNLFSENRSSTEENIINHSEKRWEISAETDLENENAKKLDFGNYKVAKNIEKYPTTGTPNKSTTEKDKKLKTEHTTANIFSNFQIENDRTAFENNDNFQESLGIDSNENYYRSVSQEEIKNDYDELSKEVDWEPFTSLSAENISSYNTTDHSQSYSEVEIKEDEFSKEMDKMNRADYSEDGYTQKHQQQAVIYPEKKYEENKITIKADPQIAYYKMIHEQVDNSNKQAVIQDSSDQNGSGFKQKLFSSTTNNESNKNQELENSVTEDREDKQYKDCHRNKYFYTNKTYNLSFLFNK